MMKKIYYYFQAIYYDDGFSSGGLSNSLAYIKYFSSIGLDIEKIYIYIYIYIESILLKVEDNFKFIMNILSLDPMLTNAFVEFAHKHYEFSAEDFDKLFSGFCNVNKTECFTEVRVIKMSLDYIKYMDNILSTTK